MINALLKYQEIDAEIKRIDDELSASEEKKKTAQAKKFVDTVSEKLGAIEQKAESLFNYFKEQEEKINKLNEAIAEFKTIIDSCTTEDETEYDYYKKEMQKYVGKVKAIETELNQLKDDINETIQSYKTLQKSNNNAVAQYKEYAPLYKKLKAEKDKEKAEKEKQLFEAEKDVGADLLALYKTKRKDKIFPVVVKAEGKVCGYCRTGLSMSAESTLNRNGYVECEACHRILYK